MATSFATSFGRPRLVASQGESVVSAGPRVLATDPALATRPGQDNIGALPSALVAQLANALSAAEAHCAATPRIAVQAVPMPPPTRVTEPTPYINVESAPFLRDTYAHGAAPLQLPPPPPPPQPIPTLQTATAVEQWIAQARREPHPLASDDDSRSDYVDGSDLPRFFDRNRRTAETLQRLTHPAAALSPLTIACGFVVGLAVIVPSLWLVNADKIDELAKRSAPLALASPLMTASTAATFVPTSAYEIAERGGAAPTEAERSQLVQAAFDEASRRIAAGDYIGARDRLRQAVTFGEERARALLDALE